MKLDQTVVDRLRTPLMRTWGELAYELNELAQQDGAGPLSNAEAIECCIDANHLYYNGQDKEADELVTALCKEHGYPKVHKFLCKNFRLA